METSGELDRNLLNLNLNLSNLIQSPSITSIDTLTPKEEYHSGVKTLDIVLLKKKSILIL